MRRTNEFIEAEHEKDTLGAIFRSKTQFYDEGEKPSKYFFNLEKSRARAKSVSALKMDDSQEVVKDQKQILNMLKSYYQKLYTSHEHTRFEKVNEGESPTLSEEMKNAMDLPFTLDEISEALKCMPNDKCPGMDGLMAEFYKVFWSKLKKPYFAAINSDIQKKRLHQSARLGLISLLPKPDRNLLLKKNWRPLMLMNIDYKIFSKAISLRLKEVMPYIIHEDQTGFMAGRDLLLNIRRILDIMQITSDREQAALMVQIDYEQAFDSIEIDSMMGILKYFNFGDRFIDYIATLFAKPQSCVMNNGWKSDYIFPTRSIKQGCAASLFLFNFCAELIAIYIRNNPAIKGVCINEIEHKISQFADDTTLFLLFEKETLQEVINTFNEFQQVLGLKVNYDKTSVYRLGSIKDTNAKLYTKKPFMWTNDPLKI